MTGNTEQEHFEAMGEHMYGSAAQAPETAYQNRNDMLAKIHIAKKQLGLDDDAYRDLLERVTGKRSAADLSAAQLRQVLADMKAKGFTPRKTGGRKPSQAERIYEPKLRALWLSGWNLGVVADPSDKAMQAFVKRQTGLDSVRFLTDAKEAAQAIEGLKAWLAREAGVQWDAPYADAHDPRSAVVEAQWKRLWRLIPDPPMALGGVSWVQTVLSPDDVIIADLGKQIREAQEARR